MSEQRPIQRGDVVSYPTADGRTWRGVVINADDPERVLLASWPLTGSADRWEKPLAELTLLSPVEDRIG